MWCMMEIVKGYFDYCISDKCASNAGFKTIAKRLFEFGYRTIAINQTVDESNLDETATESKKKKKIDKGDIVPPPIEVTDVDECKGFKILNRLTVVFSNQDVVNRITKSPNYKKYHIIAVQPESQQAFQFTCSTMDADIFSFNPNTKANYKMQRKLYNQLAERGFHFEILYAPAIEDSTKRKNIIARAHSYHSYGKSRNIIISSGSTNEFLIRSPYDIINLGLLFGLSEGQAKAALQNNGRNVYIHAMGRRIGKTIMLVESVKDSTEVDELKSDDEEMELDQPAQKKSKQ